MAAAEPCLSAQRCLRNLTQQHNNLHECFPKTSVQRLCAKALALALLEEL